MTDTRDAVIEAARNLVLLFPPPTGSPSPIGELRDALAALDAADTQARGGWLPHRPAYFTYDPTHGGAYYFAPTDRAPPPYRIQHQTTAILDIAEDGTLAGVELVFGPLPPPLPEPAPREGGEG